MARTKVKPGVIVPLILLLLLALPFFFFDNLAHDAGYDVLAKTVAALRGFLGVAVWLLLALVVNRLTNELIWDGLFENRLGKKIPKLLRDMVGIVFLLASIAGIIGSVFGKSLTFLAAATGGAGLVIGMAIKEMIADVFAGLALNTERPIVLGDFIRVGEHEGEVVEQNWRATHLRTTDNTVVVVPNSRLAMEVITNLGRDGTYFRRTFDLYLDHDIPTVRALRILNAAVKKAQANLEAVESIYPTTITDLESDAIAIDIDDVGVCYRIRYWLPEFHDWSVKRNVVIDSVNEALRDAGIRPVAPRRDVFHTELVSSELDEAERRRRAIKGTAMFSSLADGEVELLASELHLRSYPPGIDVITRGETGDSMYFILEGLLDVYIWIDKQDKEVRVASMPAGKAFGEMSLLTGEPRSATIRSRTDALVYEMTKDDITEILQKDPRVAEQISNVIAEYQMRDVQARERLSAEQTREQTENFAKQLLGKIKNFFSLEL